MVAGRRLRNIRTLMTHKTCLEDEGLFSDFSIRLVTRADLPKLEWEGLYWKFRDTFAELYSSSLSGRTLMWVVAHQGPVEELIGQAFVLLKSSERDAADGESRAYVFSFRVKEQWRNQGIGTTLMHFVEEDLRRRGFEYVTLNVAKENLAAKRLYRRLGYQVVGSRPGIWMFRDPDGNLHRMHEPSWRMIKSLSGDE